MISLSVATPKPIANAQPQKLRAWAIPFWPVWFPLAVLLAGQLSQIKQAWFHGEEYVSEQRGNLPIVYIFTLSIFAGLIMGTFAPVKARISSSFVQFSPKRIRIVFFGTLFLTMIKFVQIGSLPLIFGIDQRYTLSYSGFSDYFARSIVVMGLLAFAIGCKVNKSYFAFYILGCLAVTLLGQRQDIVALGVGAVLIILAFRRPAPRYVALAAASLFLLAYTFVGVVGILRSPTLAGAQGVDFLTPMNVLHSEMATPQLLGQFVYESVQPNLQMGRYVFGDFLGIVGSGANYGASYVNSFFLGRETAQSVGAPFGLLIDFGPLGVVVGGVVSGVILGFVYQVVKRRNFAGPSMVWYILILLEAYWSIRSGGMLLSLSALTSGALVLVCSEGGGWLINALRSFLTVAVLSWFFLALGLAILRLG